jgi:hypothetical protein
MRNGRWLRGRVSGPESAVGGEVRSSNGRAADSAYFQGKIDVELAGKGLENGIA